MTPKSNVNNSMEFYNFLKFNLYTTLYTVISSERIPVVFEHSFKFIQEVLEIPLELNFNLNAKRMRDGCYEGLESYGDTITYFFINDNKKELIDKKDILLFNESLITNYNELEELDNLTYRIFDTLYNFFENLNLKLNGINIRFIKIPEFKNNINFYLYFKLNDNTLELINVESGKKINNSELLEKFIR